MLRFFFWVLLGWGMLTACVPNQRIVYLQSGSEPKRGQVNNADTLARVYTTRYRDYRFKPHDVISLNIASITPQEFDFVKKYEEQLGIIRKLTQYDQAAMGGSGRTQGVGGISGGVGGAGISGGMGTSAIALDQMQTGFVLDEEGFLELPYIGKIMFTGFSIPQMEAAIREKLTGYFETPVVRIQLLSFHFTILGEVNKEGRYTSFDPNMTVVDAITLSNNLTDFADRSKIKIVRRVGTTAEVHYVNALSEDLLGNPGFYLSPDDIIIVPPLQARATRKYTLPAYTSVVGVVTSTLTFLFVLLTYNR